MRKDPTEFRERFLRWKNGELVYENGLALPAYEDGKAPMLDRLEFDDGTKYLQWKKDFLDRYWSSEEQKRLGLDPKKEAIKSMLHDNTAFNAGTLPGVVIKPPKDSKKVLSAAKEMLPIDKMRHNWYNNIDQIRDGFYPANNIDPYEYIRRMYNIYKASDKPRVSTTRVPEYTMLHNPFDISGKEREMYDAILNTMYLNPDSPSFIDEMSHAFQFNTDVPGDNDFLPGDWKINGKSGYERPGHIEYTAHKIIQPILRNYLENQDTDYPIDDIIEVVTDIHDNPKAWGYPTREEVMNDKRSGRIAKGPRRGQLKDRYEDGLSPLRKSEVNINEATYVPEEDLYKSRYTLPEVTITGDKSKRVYHSYAPRTSGMSKNQYKLLTGDLLGAMTTGMNVLSPSLWWGAVRDANGLQDGFNRLMRGNSGFVTDNFEREHPYISLGANFVGDALSSGMFNNVQRASKLSRLKKMVTGIPNKQDNITGELLPNLFRKGYGGEIWTSNNPDYAHYFTNGGEKFDIYVDPKKLNLLDTPKAPNGTYFVWNRLPFKISRGKISLDPIAKIDNSAFMYSTKKDAIDNTDSFGILNRSSKSLNPIMEERLMNKNGNLFKEGLKTDNVVDYSRRLNKDGVVFHNVYDGGLEDSHGLLYDIPIEEIVLNPGAEYFWTEHNAGKKELFNKMPYYNTLPWIMTGSATNALLKNETRSQR